MAQWIEPTGVLDPDNIWINDNNAMDGSTSTYAYTVHESVGWAGLVYVTVDPLYCSKIRYWPSYITSVFDQIKVEGHYNDTWNTIYQGSFTNQAWNEKTIPSGPVLLDQLRFNFHCSSGQISGRARLHEVQFWSQIISLVGDASSSSGLTGKLNAIYGPHGLVDEISSVTSEVNLIKTICGECSSQSQILGNITILHNDSGGSSMGLANYKVNDAIVVSYQAPNKQTGLTGVVAEIYLPSGQKDSNFPDVALTEVGATGVYKGSFTPDEVGEWIALCHKADGDGQVIKQFPVGAHNVSSVGEAVGTVDGKVVTVDGKVTAVGGAVSVVDGKVVAVDGKADTIITKIDNLETTVGGLDTPAMCG
jgi:hypothetical protein